MIGTIENPKRNHEGYLDLTAYFAIYGGFDMALIKCGEVFKKTNSASGNEEIMLVVNKDGNKTRRFVMCVKLSDMANPYSEYNAEIIVKGEKMYAECDMIRYEEQSKLEERVDRIDSDSMKKVRDELVKVFGLEPGDRHRPTPEGRPESDTDLIKAKAAAAIYKDLYEKLLERMLTNG